MGKRIALAVTAFAGTWLFLGLHAVWWSAWFAFVETAPYGVLTMVLSLEAIVLGTLILMGQNLTATRDHAALEVDRERHKRIEHIAEHIERVEAAQLRLLHHIETAAALPRSKKKYL